MTSMTLSARLGADTTLPTRICRRRLKTTNTTVFTWAIGTKRVWTLTFEAVVRIKQIKLSCYDGHAAVRISQIRQIRHTLSKVPRSGANPLTVWNT